MKYVQVTSAAVGYVYVCEWYFKQVLLFPFILSDFGNVMLNHVNKIC